MPKTPPDRPSPQTPSPPITTVDDSPTEQRVDVGVVASSTRSTAVAQGVTQTVRFGTNLVLARLLTPRDFGVVAVAILVTAFLDQFRDMGTGGAIIQRPTVNQVLLNTVFYLNVALGLIASLCLFLFASPLANLLGNPESAPVVQAFAAITLLNAIGQIHFSLLRRSMRFRQIALITATSAVVTAVLSVAGAAAGMRYWSLVIGTAMGVAVQTVMLWTLDRWRPTLSVSFASLRSIWRFSWHLFLSGIIFFAWNQTDKVVVGRATGGVGLGTYTMGQRIISTPLSALSAVIDDVTFPAFSRRQSDHAALRSGFTRSSNVIALVTFPLMLGLAVVAAPLVAVMLGPKWDALIPLIWVLAPAGAAQSVTTNTGQLLLAKGRADYTYRWGLLYVAVVTAFEIVGSRWGIVGIASGFAIGTLLLTPFSLMLAFHQIQMRLRDYLHSLWPYAWMAGVMALATAGVRVLMVGLGAPQIVELVCAVLTGCATYGGLLAVVRPPALRDALTTLRGGSR